MANKLTLESLKDVIKDSLKAPNRNGIEITDETKLNEILSSEDGFSTSTSSMSKFKGDMLWIIWENGGQKVKFPSNWMGFSVTELAEFIMSKQETE